MRYELDLWISYSNASTWFHRNGLVKNEWNCFLVQGMYQKEHLRLTQMVCVSMKKNSKRYVGHRGGVAIW